MARDVGGARRAALVGILVACGAALHGFETLVPLPVPVPGAKVGLANLTTLLGLALAGPGVAVTVAVLRVLLVGLVSGTMLSVGFALSAAGAVASSLTMSLLWLAGRGAFSLVGVSLVGGVAHNLGQLGVATVYVGKAAATAYVAPLVLAGLVAGYLVGRLADLVAGVVGAGTLGASGRQTRCGEV